MKTLRIIYLLACAGCLAYVACTVTWKATLTVGNTSWIFDLGRAPVWSAPPDPGYEEFREKFDDSDGFPLKQTPGLTIESVPKLGWSLIELLLYVGAVTLVCGLAYVAIRGERRDLTLHLALHTGAALAVSSAICIGLWLVLGGWGPPGLLCFGSLGVVVGLAWGFDSYAKSSRENSNSRPHP